MGNNGLTLGITDGFKRNEFYLIFSIVGLKPCAVIDGTRRGNSGLTNVTISGGYTLLFDPENQFGTCTTNNGISIGGRFNTHVTTSLGLRLVICRIASDQNLIFNYFLIELL